MAFDPCDVCGCVHANFASNESFKVSVGRALCALIDAVTAGGGGEAGPQVNVELLCDDDGAGTVTQFFRRVITDALGNNTVEDFLLDGVTPYVPVGTVGQCCCGAECNLLPTSVIACYPIAEDTLVQTFDVSTGADQIINPPLGAVEVTITAWGAGGGTRPEGLVVAGMTNSTGGLGGTGGFAEGTFAAQQLILRVGDGGSHADVGGSFPGGGNGGTTVGGFAGASGGGYSGVFNTLLAPLVIAGAGGGAAGFSAAGASANGGRGGPGGGTLGVDGTAGSGAGTDNFPGTGGTQVAGGTGGTADPSQVAEAGAAGASLQGGAGGPGNLHNGNANGSGGGGGGGGYFGGGGGAGMSNIPGEDASGGGGGSGFVDPSATGASLVAGSLAGPLGTVGNSGHALYNGTAGTVTAFSVAAAPSQDGQISLTWAIGGAGVFGRAILWASCDGTEREWRDTLTGAVIDEADIVECESSSVTVEVPDDNEIIVLCDNQGGGTIVPFLRHISTDPAGVVTVTDTELDGTTPYVVIGTEEICGGTGSVNTQQDREAFLLLDDQSVTSVAFIRHIVDDGGVITVTDTELDGVTPYVVTGVVKPGDIPSALHEHILEDTVQTFIRRVQINDEQQVFISDWELDGVTPYVAVGTVTVAATSTQPDREVLVLFDDNGATSTAFLRHIRDNNGVVTVTNTTLDGTTAYVITGTVKAASFAESQSVVPLYDKTATDSIEFFRKITLNSEGVTTVTDTTLDGTTAYVVVGTPQLNPEYEAIFETLTTLGFAGISGAYALLLNPSGDLKFIEIFNATDTDVVISFDAGATDHWFIGTQEGRTFDIGQLELFQAQNIHVKDNGVAATTGEVRIMGYR